MLGEMFRVENADMPVKKMGVSDTEYLLTLTPPKIERRLFWCEVFLITPKIIGGGRYTAGGQNCLVVLQKKCGATISIMMM